MSVCIAAICKGKDFEDMQIVAMCDRKASSVEFSNEDCAIKADRFLDGKWLAMYAGNDISPCEPILAAIRQELSKGDERVTVERVKGAFEKHYQAYLSNLATARVLGRWKLSMEKFLETGRKHFGADVFDNLVAQIERIGLQFQFLVAGFDWVGNPHIFTVKNPGYIEDRTTPGYWAIGSGDFAAMSTLGFFRQKVIENLSTTYYNVMAAKFMAEKASHEIGEKSLHWQFGKDGKDKAVGWLEVPIRTVWEQIGQPKTPSWFISELEENLISGKSDDAFLQALIDKFIENGIKPPSHE
jgi:hypothetical protein